MKNIVISPFSKKLRNGKNNAKNYPYWKELIELMKRKGYKIVQIGVEGEEDLGTDHFIKNLPIDQLKELLSSSDLWISVDNFINHFGSFIDKKGIVIFGKSDPNIFGYDKNINLLKSREYLRKNQFFYWEEEEYNKDVFISPEEIMKTIDYNF